MKMHYHDQETSEGRAAFAAERNTAHPAFQAIEAKFDTWMDAQREAGTEAEEQYFGDEAIYTKKGAIREAMWQIQYVMQEAGITSIDHDDNRIDYDEIFQS